MKKIITGSIFAIVFILTALPQTFLINDLHSLKSGINNQMIYTDYADPGFAGADVTWDFSDLSDKKSFTGFLNPSATSKNASLFTDANTELIEFESYFYFNVTSSQIEEYGYSSADGRSQIRYEHPAIKMKYPFGFGDSYSGTLSGNYFYNGIKNGTIKGTYAAEADAYGTLMLPGGRHFENTLRVRSEKRYINTMRSCSQEVEIVTYRWYDMGHRYPLLVLTNYSVISGETKTEHYQAAYTGAFANSLEIISEEGIELFPVPSGSELHLAMNIVYSGTICMDIFNLRGQKIRSFQRNVSQTGSAEFDLSSEISGMKPSDYLLIIRNGERTYKKSFSLIE